MAVYKTKMEIVYDTLLGQIAEGYYQEGDRLIISQVAKETGVSDIPVREAIRCLEREGYVKINVNQGAVVCSLTKESMVEIFHIRAVLEGLAARMSVDYLTEADYAELRRYNQRLKEALRQNDNNAHPQANMDFHLRIYSVIPHRMLYDMIADLWKKYSITKSVFSLVPGRAVESVAEHEQIIVLMEQGRRDEVEALMRQHKLLACKAFCEQIEQRESARLGECDDGGKG